MRVTDTLWQNLLELKAALKQAEQVNFIVVNDVSFALGEDLPLLLESEQQWDLVLCLTECNPDGFAPPEAVFKGQAFYLFRQGLPLHSEQILRHYMPLAASRFIFKNKSFLIAHAAQSLDGKMCTLNGASQWIGNEANLIHAHRIRAMVDGIIVGANTVRNEHPKLSVRHVQGDNPKRVVLCNSFDGFTDSDLRDTVFICAKGSQASQLGISGATSPCSVIELAPDCDKKVSVVSLRNSLLELGIQSLMLEGGPETFSQFIRQGGVDWLQVHISPMLFGSGKGIYEDQQILQVSEALTMDNPLFVQMDDGVMMSGELMTHG